MPMAPSMSCATKPSATNRRKSSSEVNVGSMRDLSVCGGHRQMDAALRLVPAAPAAGAAVFAGLYAAGARHATDGKKSIGLERVPGKVVTGEIGVEVGRGPGR